jgi:hypothetical protein
MRLRLIALLALTGVSCFAAATSAAHGKRSVTAVARIPYNAGPTLLERLGRAPNNESLSYIANVQQRWAALAGCS